MGFLAPTAALIAAGITIPLLVSLYLLKRRRPRIQVSSTLLWQKAIQDLHVNAPFQKLRKTLLLLLQFLVLAALLTAFARPTIHADTPPANRMIILIDHSASMNATDIAPSRLSHAKELALQLIQSLDTHRSPIAPNSGAMVISFAHRARVVEPFTTDKARLRQAIQSIQPTDQLTNLDPALQLIQPYTALTSAPNASAAGHQDDRPTVYVISDGQFHDTTELSIQNAKARFLTVGHQPNNLAIVALSARPIPGNRQRLRVFARLASYSPHPVKTYLTIKIDNRVHRVLEINLPPAATTDQPTTKVIQFDLPVTSPTLLELNHDYPDDLAADNTAWLVLNPPRQPRVLLVTPAPGNALLKHAIRAFGVEHLQAITPKQYEHPTTLIPNNPTGRPPQNKQHHDIIIFDRHSPSSVPSVNSMYWNAAPPLGQLTPLATDAPPTDPQFILDWDHDHPVLEHVALDDLLIAQPTSLALPDTAQVLATTQAGPVIWQITQNQVHHLIVNFDLLKTNWMMQLSFPIFISNAIHWLTPSHQTGVTLDFTPGQVAIVPVTLPVRSIRYQGPQTLEATAIPSQPSITHAVLPAFEKVGVYHTQAPVPASWQRLPVSLTNSTESDLTPATQFHIGLTTITGQPATTASRQETWRWFAAGALILLIIEWVVYTRRARPIKPIAHGLPPTGLPIRHPTD